MSQATSAGEAGGRGAVNREQEVSPERRERQEKHSVTLSAVVFLVGALLSRGLGLYRDTLIARYLSEDVRDAFLNAFRLPNLFRRIFVEGGLSASFVPVHAQIEARTPERAQEFRSAAFAVLLSFSITVSLLLILFMDDVMRFLLSGSVYLNVPGKFGLTVSLARIMFGFFVLISLYGYFAAILSGLKRFAAVAFAPCFFNIAIVAAAKLSRGSTVPEFIIAWAVLLGGFLQVAVLLPVVVKKGQLPGWSWNWRMPEVVQFLKLIGPTLFSLAIPQLVVLVNTRFAADLASGTHSYLYLAERLLEFPLSLFAVSLGTTLLPTLSQQWSKGDREAMSETFNHIARLVVFLALPSAIGLFMLAQPICETLFLGREFKYDDVLATAQVIRIYSFALVFWAGARILSQGFYAIQNLWYPPVAGGVALVSHVLFCWALTRSFRLEGLAAAFVLSSIVHFFMLAVAYNSWIGRFEAKKMLVSLGKFAVCSLVLAVMVHLHGPLHQALAGRFRGGRELALAAAIFLAATAYFLSAALLRVPEFRETVTAFSRKLDRILKEGRRQSGEK